MSLHSNTSHRRRSMSRSACQGVVGEALATDDVIEILANADGSVWIERAGRSVAREAEVFAPEARELIIRLVLTPGASRIARIVVGEVCCPEALDLLNA